MNKFIIILILIIIVTMLLTFTHTNISVLVSEKIKLNTSSFTKAVCEEKYCQDYLFNCNNEKIISIAPITGAAVKFDENWKDPRTEEQIGKLC